MIGKTLSHFKILEELGRGGMGIVYKAEDTKLHRTVAVKVLPTNILASEDDRARFYREARAAAQLSHPNIATVFAIDEAVPEGAEDGSDARLFIAMEFIEGESLEARLKSGPLKLKEAIRIASDIAGALDAAHKKDIVHRDIKSANVILTTDGKAKVLDFGLAKTAQSTKLTRMGSTLGTVSYMSPQQARVEEVDLRTDLWSLGVVLYELISGQLPFGAEYEQAVVYGILNEDPEPLTALRTGVPMELERVVSKCLAKDLERRYQHADDLIADLGGIDLTKVTSQTSMVTGEPIASSTRPRWLIVGGVALGALITAAMFLLLVPNRERSHLHAKSIQRLTVEPMLEMWPSIHPNGDRVVYAGISNGKHELYYRSIEGGPAQKFVSGFEGEQRTPSYSPDGSQILFESEGSIFSVEALGGVPRPIVRPRPGEADLEFPSWSPTGNEIAFTSFDDSLFVINLETGRRTALASVQEPHSPSWSPNGRYIAVISGNDDYARNALNVANSTIWIVSTEDGSATRLTSGSSMDMSPVWTPDGLGIVFVSTAGGGADVRIQRVSKSGLAIGPPYRVTTGLNLHSVRISRDGSQIVAGQFEYDQNIWRSPLRPGVVASASDATPVTTGNQIIEGVFLSPDGSWLAYDSNIRGETHIFKMPADGGNPQQITTGSGPNFVYSWSPDGDELAFHRFDDGIRNVYTVSLDVLSVSPVSRRPAHERFPTWSPEKDKLGFPRNNGQLIEFVVAERKTGDTWSAGEVLFSFDGNNFNIRWSPTADLVAYLDDGNLYLRHLDEGISDLLIPNENLAMRSPAWSLDGMRVYVLATESQVGEGIWSVPVTGGSPQLVIRYDDELPGFDHFAVGTDALYYTLRETQSDIWVIDLDD
ncbi:MAG: hypothetical protein BMS9Abin05_1859 [Rhodothermia bacterium]|nr:MAG: hypothetical protein BMS9Abin05_1859 [Rhodothermia bacterium]